MPERTSLGYCVDCPIAAVLNTQIEVYLADAPSEGFDESSVEILSSPPNLTDEEIEDASKAFSMSDREAIRYGVSEGNLNEMRREVAECYRLLGIYALEENCQGPKTALDGTQACGLIHAERIIEKLADSFNRNMWGDQNG
jgi:hypothetical protein